MRKSLTLLASLMAAGLLLTGCGSHAVHHHSHPARTSKVDKSRCQKSSADSTSTVKHKKMPKANKRDMNKSGLSNREIKKNSRAINKQKSKSDQPVD